MEMEKWIDRKQNTHFLQNVSTAIRWHQTMRHTETEERIQDGEIVLQKTRPPHASSMPPLCPMDPAPCSAASLMKSRPQSLSIWPVCPSPVKGNRLAEQRHYITICRCRRARQRREERHGALGERKGLWHPSLSHLG